MAQGLRRLCWTVTTASIVMGLAIGCGDDGGGSSEDDSGEGGTAGDDGSGGIKSGGGTAGQGSGGKSGSAGTQNTPGGETGDGGEPPTEGGTGGGGGEGANPPKTGSIDDVVNAVCEWEFRCCDDGERAYRLSPFADDAADCARRLIYELRESNAKANPYLSGPASKSGLLGLLGYTVDLARVELDPVGAAECEAYWADLGCNEDPAAGARCDGSQPTTNPCALTNLFRPKLKIGDPCTPELAETATGNDVECEAGATCLPAAHPDNPRDVPTCVRRGREGEPCTADDDCDYDFYCANGDCTEKGDVGDDCSFNDPDEPAPGDEDAQCKAGLTCHPVDLTCSAPCTSGARCTQDVECPEGFGCAPLLVAESSTTFKVCTELGTSAADLCDTDEDCAESYHCTGANCRPDREQNAACAAHNHCATGLYCDMTNTGTCVPYLMPMAACTEDAQCGPEPARCVNVGTAGRVCRRGSLLDLGAECGDDAACQSSRCELATSAATVRTCVAGAEEDDPCDAVVADGTARRCGPGLFCLGDTGAVGSGTCVAQVGPGEACLDEEGEPNAMLCANRGACADAWNEGAVCTDAFVPKDNGGSGVTCDGA